MVFHVKQSSTLLEQASFRSAWNFFFACPLKPSVLLYSKPRGSGFLTCANMVPYLSDHQVMLRVSMAGQQSCAAVEIVSNQKTSDFS